MARMKLRFRQADAYDAALRQSPLAVKAAKVAPADYAAAKKFFDDVMKGDSMAVGLEEAPAP